MGAVLVVGNAWETRQGRLGRGANRITTQSEDKNIMLFQINNSSDFHYRLEFLNICAPNMTHL